MSLTIIISEHSYETPSYYQAQIQGGAQMGVRGHHQPNWAWFTKTVDAIIRNPDGDQFQFEKTFH